MESLRQPLQAQDQDSGGNCGAHRRPAAQAKGDHVPWRVRRRASGAFAASDLRQKQGRHSRSPALPPTHHISKGRYRPHVPQELRAINLAAFEMVDYVIIDREADAAEESGADQARHFRQRLRIPVERAAAEDPRGARGDSLLWRRDHIHARRLCLLLESADRSGAAVACASRSW